MQQKGNVGCTNLLIGYGFAPLAMQKMLLLPLLVFSFVVTAPLMEVNVTNKRAKQATRAKRAVSREAASQRLKTAHNTI